MPFLPWFRAIIFSLATLLGLAVLAICAHIEYKISGIDGIYLSFAALGLAAGAVTAVSMPLFLILGRLKTKVFTSMIVFEIVWGFLLWVFWIATAGDSAAAKAYYFTEGCIYGSTETNQLCYEFTVVEALSFIIFFSVFVYYDTLVLYSIINTIRGRGVWTSTVYEASTAPVQIVGVPMTQYVPVAAPQGQPQYNYGPGAPPMGGPPQGQYGSFNGQSAPQGQYGGGYNTAPMPANPQFNYNNYSQAPVPGSPNNYGQAPIPGSPAFSQPQQPYQGHSPAPSNNAQLPPQPNYNSYPQTQLPLPSGYQQQGSPYPQQS